MKKVGIIGAGNVAKAHAKAVQQLNNAELSKIYDLNIHTAESFAREYGGIVAENIENFFDDIDAVVIATPNFAHYKYAALSSLYSVPVICEKPLACSIKEARVMLSMSDISKQFCATSFNYRHLPIVSRLLHMMEDGILGEIISIKLEFLKDSALRKKNISWRDQSSSNMTSGSLGDLGAHLIDLACFITKQNFKKDSLKSSTKTLVNKKSDGVVMVDDNAHVFSNLEDGTFAEIRTSKTESTENLGLNIFINGTKADFTYYTKDKNKYRLKTGILWKDHYLDRKLTISDPENEVYGWSDTFLLQMESFLQQEKTLIATFEDGVKVQNIIEDALNAGDKNKKLIYIHQPPVSESFNEIKQVGNSYL